MPFFRILIIILLIYFTYNLVKGLLSSPNQKDKNFNGKSNVKIFKRGDVEKSKYDVESEDVDFVEIEDDDEKSNTV